MIIWTQLFYARSICNCLLSWPAIAVTRRTVVTARIVPIARTGHQVAGDIAYRRGLLLNHSQQVRLFPLVASH